MTDTPSTPATLEPIWDWSPQAVMRFFQSAKVAGKKELHIRDGLNAALAEDMALLAPAIARFWIETLAEAPALQGRALTVTVGEEQVQVPITRELMLSLCLLDTPAPTPEPAPTLIQPAV